MVDKKTEKFLRKHIKRHKEKLGMDQDQAVAVALAEAREKGLDVSPAPDGTKAMERMK